MSTAALPNDYLERVYAGVLGKLIGVYVGRPFEGWTYQRIMQELGPIEYYVHDRLDVPLVVTDDDVAGTFTFVRALEDYGVTPDLSAEAIGKAWLNYLVEHRSVLWWGGNGNSTEHTAWLNLRRGVAAPASGSIAENGTTVAEQIGAQIFIDGWAMVAPGQPALAARLAEQAGKVSHDGESVHAAVLWAAMEAEAFVSADIDHLIDTGLAQIPKDSRIAALIADIRAWHREHPDWHDTRQRIEERYGYDKYPGNCHVVPNHALMIMAVLYAPDDFQRAQMIVNTSGWDTDCNAGNVGCLIGIMHGLEGIEAGPDWRGPLADRMLISSADGGNAINDAVRVAYQLAGLGSRLAGGPDLARPKDGAQFHFSLPGSVQGFRAERGHGLAERLDLENIVVPGGRALALRYRGLGPGQAAAATTPTFSPPEVANMRT
ncbi:MAG TPA: ADP-ribosylglycohydrolase family protein, partial [Inquilinus sp.]